MSTERPNPERDPHDEHGEQEHDDNPAHMGPEHLRHEGNPAHMGGQAHHDPEDNPAHMGPQHHHDSDERSDDG